MEWVECKEDSNYLVNRNGQIYSKRYKRILKVYDNGNGYLTVNFCTNRHSQRCYVHRVVANAFISNPFNLPEINHKDCNPSNNCVDNLEWCTSKYNKNYKDRAYKFTVSRGYPVICVETGVVYHSCGEAQRATGIKRGEIHSCCTGYRNAKTAGGYHWCFAEKRKEDIC